MSRFVRHLLAVTVVVALVVGLGYAWSHSGAAGIVADGDRGRAPAAGSAASPAGSSPARRDRRPEGGDRRGAGGPSLSNADDLVQTLVALGALVGGVVALDVVRRRRRGSRPRTASPAPSA